EDRCPVPDQHRPGLVHHRPARRSINELVRLDPELKEHEPHRAEPIYRLEDVAASISSYESDIEDDPQRLADIEERLDLISRLKRKYGISTIEDILQRTAANQAELETIVHSNQLHVTLHQQDGQL